MMHSLNVIPPHAAPSAVVPPAKTPPKADQILDRAELSRLCERVLGADGLRHAGRVLWGWLHANRARLRGSGRETYGRRLARFLMSGGKGSAPYGVMQRANVKVPYWQFSTLPVFTCPGAGECAQWCYSFHAWRYPVPFYRQLQNTLLLRFSPDHVRSAFLSLPQGATFRLYVDGDFNSLESVRLWMAWLTQRPDVRAYGYSKSWDLLREYHRSGGAWAGNYVVNLSSGGQGYATREEMEALPITRGVFLVLADVRVPKSKPGADTTKRYLDPAYRAQLREAARSAGLDRYFPCPGDCGSCAGGRVVCASGEMGITVVIGAH